MIIRELDRLYRRLADDVDIEIAAPGWSTEQVAGEIVISTDGHISSVIPYVGSDANKNQKYRRLRVPQHKGRSGAHPAPYFLCDTGAYLAGLENTGDGGNKTRVDTAEAKRQRSHELHKQVLEGCLDDAAKAVLAFFETRQADAISFDSLAMFERIGYTRFYVFRLNGDSFLIHERKAIVEAWESYCAGSVDEQEVAQCSVTGERASISRLFPQVTGFPGGNSSGVSLVSFNKDAFNSYGHTQAYNASISDTVAFNAGTALKYLCTDSRHKTQIGDTLVLFWADQPAPLEEGFFSFLLTNTPAEDAATQQMIEEALNNLRQGKAIEGFDPNVKFYVLGLSPNLARLSVRFFEQSTLGDFANNVGQFLKDIEMVDVRPTKLYHYLLQTAPRGEGDNLPSTLINPSYSAMLRGTVFPQSIQTLILGRMRADHASNNRRDMGQRAALLKAELVRRARMHGKESDLTVALNRTNQDPGYLLGRLFAVMEHAQRGALGSTNSTIRDRYIGGASTTPARVFQPLLRGCQAHLNSLRKSKPGLAIVLEKELDEIIGRQLPAEQFPAVLSQDQQALFFIGYYQERVALWERPSSNEESDKS